MSAGIAAFGFRALCLTILLTPDLLFALDTNSPESSLRPPRGEIVPSFWEQYGLSAIFGAVVLLGIIGVVIWLILRPKPPVPIDYPAEARRELQGLRQKSEDGTLLSRTSRILRSYLAGAFSLPPVELTTTEFCKATMSNPAIDAELAVEIGDFLRACDRRKFAPGHTEPPLGAVDRAEQIIDHAENRLAAVKREQGTTASVNNPEGHERQSQGMASGA